MVTDMIFCINHDCPYHDECWQSIMRAEIKVDMNPAANLGVFCTRYAHYVAHRNDYWKAKVKQKCH